MQRRGLTLIELLVTLAIIVAIVALVMPALINSLSERAFTSISDQIKSHMLLSRIEAMTTRSPLEVRYAVDRNMIETVPFQQGVRSITEGEFRQAASGAGSDGGSLDQMYELEDDFYEDELEPWMRFKVPTDFTIVNKFPDSFEEEYEEGFYFDLTEEQMQELGQGDAEFAGEDFAFDFEEELVRLAVYLPDGSALLSDPVWFIDEDGRRAKLVVNPWTGVPEIERLATVNPDDLDSNSEDEFDIDEEEDERTREDNRRDNESEATTKPNEDAGDSSKSEDTEEDDE